MPIRLRFPVSGPAPVSPFQHASGLRALVLRWIAAADKELATEIHDANQTKPYSLSPLRRCETAQGGDLAFELALLADWLIQPVAVGFARCGREVRLGPQLYRMAEPEIVAEASWDTLLAPPRPLPVSFDLRLLSPTAHHAPDSERRRVAAHEEPAAATRDPETPHRARPRKSVVLPTPELYFGSWLGRWQVCCERALDAGLMRVVEERVAVTACAGQTRAVRLDGGRVFIGFEGTVRFAVLHPEEVPPEPLAGLHTLARFAEFCGTGVDTMRGMGQTRLVQGRNRL